ncbi:MAG: hypothetical protein EOM76_07040 [Sphingobacteriia bacterium]|nr:hypothetical protein [Sphingobacteriia bacterium]
MKNVKPFKIFIILMLLLASNYLYAQINQAQLNVYFSLPEVALLDLEPNLNNDVLFSIESNGESGSSASVHHSSTTIWINYSSSLSGSQSSRTITAEISQGFLPEGILLFLQASEYSGTGGGAFGHSSGKVALSSQPKPIITNIGNCFTGDGINNGHLLSFSVEISDYSKIVSVENSNLLVLYTITDN